MRETTSDPIQGVNTALPSRWAIYIGFCLSLNIPAQAQGIYGMGISGDALANTRLGGPFETNVHFMRFRAQQTSNLTAFRFYYLGPPDPGYAAGTGGTWSAGVHADDGSADHLPSGSPLVAATHVEARAQFNGEAGYLITLTTPVPLVAGNLYHLVLTNTDASPTANYFSPDYWYLVDIPDRRAGTKPYPDQIHPLMPNSDWGHGYKIGSVWTIRQGYLPVLDLTYANGKHQGWSYGEASYAGVDEVGEISGADKMVRERITVSGADRIVTGAGIRLLRIAGGTSPLTVRLEGGNGGVIDSFTIPAERIPVGPAPDFGSTGANDLGTAARWASGAFPAPHTLAVGKTYRLRLSTAAGTTYWTWVNRRLSRYGYDAATYFSDGVAEFTRNGNEWSHLGRSKGDQDLQFYFTTTSPGSGVRQEQPLILVPRNSARSGAYDFSGRLLLEAMPKRNIPQTPRTSPVLWVFPPEPHGLKDPKSSR